MLGINVTTDKECGADDLAIMVKAQLTIIEQCLLVVTAFLVLEKKFELIVTCTGIPNSCRV